MDDNHPSWDNATLAHLRNIAAKREALRVHQEEAEVQWLTALARAKAAGQLDLTNEFHAYDALRSLKSVGSSKRWAAIVGPVPNPSQRRSLPNGPHGSWFGDMTSPRPPGRTSVVYVLFDADNVPCYVGSTSHFSSRLRRHEQDGKPVVRWTAYPCRDRGDAYEMERRLLAEHKPYLNRAPGRRAAA